MNKTLILVVAAVMVVGGGYWYVTSGSGNVGPGMMGDKGSMMEKAGSTFASMMSSGENVVCEYSLADGINQSSGRIYMAGSERFRGDFTITAPVAMESHMIRDGDYNYMWASNMQGQGIKMAVTAENKGKLFDSKDVNIPDDVGYDCSPWSVDASMFALPSGVSFMDMGAQMEQMQKMMPKGTPEGAAVPSGAAPDIKAMQCAVCEQVPGEGREQCRMALGCK